MDVTQVWMFGVVAMMGMFAAFALVGYFIHKSRRGGKNG